MPYPRIGLPSMKILARDPTFVKTRQQIHQGRFAGAGRPDQRDGLARLRVKGNICPERSRCRCRN